MANPALLVAGSPDQGTTKAIIKTDATGKLLTVGENADVVAALTTLKNTVATESSLQSLVSASEPVTSVLNTTHFAEQQAAIDSTAIDITPYENIFVEVSGTLAGANVTLKGSLDGDSFWSLMMTPCTSSELSKTSMDTQGIFSTNIAGLSHVQACLMGSTAETLVTVKSMATTLARAGASQVNVSDRASRKLGEVTLSGTFAPKEQVLLPRALRTATAETSSCVAPPWARGFSCYLVLYGVTGTFNTDDGVRLTLSHRVPASIATRTFRSVGTKRHTALTTHQILFYPSMPVPDFNFVANTHASTAVLSAIPLPVHGVHYFSASIKGAFGEGQGVDCSLHIEWLP
jgi:hypothetical protein